MKSLSVWLFVTPWTIAHQAPLSMGFSRQEYWSGLPFPSPGDLPDPGIEPRSPSLHADALTSEPPEDKTKAEDLTILVNSFIYSSNNHWAPTRSRVQSQVKYKIQRLKINLDLCKEIDRICNMVSISLDIIKDSGRAWREKSVWQNGEFRKGGCT